jgi:hypothetical protein
MPKFQIETPDHIARRLQIIHKLKMSKFVLGLLLRSEKEREIERDRET